MASGTLQLLLFSRQHVVKPTVFNLNEALLGMDRMLQRIIGEDIDLLSKPGARLGHVEADASNIEQVIMNLVINARDAMPTGGKVTIETSNTTLDDDYAADHAGVKPGRYVMLAVSDTGSGMDEAVQARIFEPFFTTKGVGKGTGLGLAIVFGIVQQSGGHVAVYSEVGHGTTFKIYLPRVDARRDTLGTPIARNSLRGSETVLLVEDEEQVRVVARTILQRNGYQVLEARNGGEALLLCEGHRETIHVLLSDVVMPQMSGPDVARRLKELRPDMLVIFMSGYTDDSVVRHGVIEQGTAFLQKPITPDTLTRKLREVLDDPPGSRT